MLLKEWITILACTPITVQKCFSASCNGRRKKIKPKKPNKQKNQTEEERAIILLTGENALSHRVADFPRADGDSLHCVHLPPIQPTERHNVISVILALYHRVNAADVQQREAESIKDIADGDSILKGKLGTCGLGADLKDVCVDGWL